MEIRKAVEQFYEEMSQMGMNAESMNLNINYLLFQLIHLASEQDNDVNQEEILRLISESSFENTMSTVPISGSCFGKNMVFPSRTI